jgi:hypothetical protein
VDRSKIISEMSIGDGFLCNIVEAGDMWLERCVVLSGGGDELVYTCITLITT